MKRILIPVDGSEPSLSTLKAVLAERVHGPVRIDLVNVQPLFSRHVAGWIGKQQRDAWRAERARAVLEPLRAVLEAAGVEHGIHVRCGDVETEIAAAARELHADEIVRPRPAPFRYERVAVPAGLGLIALLILADE